MSGVVSQEATTSTNEESACCGPDCCSTDAATTTAHADSSPDNTPVGASAGNAGVASTGRSAGGGQSLSDPEYARAVVREKYGAIAISGETAFTTGDCGCGGDSGCGDPVSWVGESYSNKDGYVAESDLGLGCGIPTDFANIQRGETVLDLGSGAGNDAFVASRDVGPGGLVIGVDMTPEMITLARANASKVDASNVEFRLGEIEHLPVQDASVDLVISNCVLNLVPDKARAFAETHRVLRPGGRFCVSDIVLEGDLPPNLRSAAELYVGCVSGALQKTAYLNAAKEAGFEDIEVVKEREIAIPDGVVAQVAGADGLAAFRSSGARVLSITVRGSRR